VPLEFQDGRAFYDGAHDSVVFEGVDGANKVRCSVAREAIFALDPKRPVSPHGLLNAFQVRRAVFEGLAAGKHGRKKENNDGSITVTGRDLVGGVES